VGGKFKGGCSALRGCGCCSGGPFGIRRGVGVVGRGWGRDELVFFLEPNAVFVGGELGGGLLDFNELEELVGFGVELAEVAFFFWLRAVANVIGVLVPLGIRACGSFYTLGEFLSHG
jgi:hypothetical protein